MCRILLGLIIDLPLPHGFSNVRLVRAICAVLDFVYLAQYPVHSTRTLELLEDALASFHANKDVFIDLGIRDSFNIPKLHFAQHYVRFIRLYGTLDNFSTEYTERLHIDLAKDAYEATNHKDEFRQMTVWLERKEKILRHHQYIQWRLKEPIDPSTSSTTPWTSPAFVLDRPLSMTKHPSVRAVPLTQLATEYGATHFREALARFILLQNDPETSRRDLERNLWNVRLPFTKLPVWHRIKYQRVDPSMISPITSDSIHCHPQRLDIRGNTIPARFDTALINDGTGADIGVQGYRVGRVRVIFTLPKASLDILFEPGVEVPEHLAFVDWFSPFTQVPERNHGLYKVRPIKDAEGSSVSEVIPIANIRRSVHLFPHFGPFAPPEWTSNNVLDLCDTFFVNTFTDRHMYRIVI